MERAFLTKGVKIIEIDPLNTKKTLEDLHLFCVIVSPDEKAFRELEKEIESKYFCFKDRRRTTLRGTPERE